MTVAYALETPRLRLKAYDPEDALALVEAVRASRPHLRPYMPFAQHEPEADAYVELMVDFRKRFDNGDFAFSIWTREGQLVGGCGVHPHVSEGGREVGYWIVHDALGQGYAGEAVAALCHLAFVQEGVDRVELRIEPGNTASVRVAEKCGFVREALLRRRLHYAEGDARDVLVYTLFADEWPHSPVHEVAVARFDAAGRPVG